MTLLLLLACQRFAAPDPAAPAPAEPRGWPPVGGPSEGPSTPLRLDPRPPGPKPNLDLDGDGYTQAEGDGDDRDWFRNPGRVEHGNSLDDDCDGTVDEGWVGNALAVTYHNYVVADGQWLGGWLDYTYEVAPATGTGDIVCRFVGEYVLRPDLPTPCPDCTWWFTVGIDAFEPIGDCWRIVPMLNPGRLEDLYDPLATRQWETGIGFAPTWVAPDGEVYLNTFWIYSLSYDDPDEEWWMVRAERYDWESSTLWVTENSVYGWEGGGSYYSYYSDGWPVE